MLPTRFVPQLPHSSTNMRKSRHDGKQSLLPKPRRPGSTDRLSADVRRPSTTSRSSSAEPPRATIGSGRFSREASATKLPLSGRSRSQQGGGQVSMTPLRSSRCLATTPVRTPSDDRSGRNWETSLERALAFVTIKDQRPVSTAAWQRAAMSRAMAGLAARGLGAALLRPLTIARFVDIVAGLLDQVLQERKLNTDNYVAKLPHVCKRMLYPGTVSKSWLKCVNTLHAFPHALALIVYMLDLLDRIESPVPDEVLYKENDELACLRREYLRKSWLRFQEPCPQFEDLDEEYLHSLKSLLGYDEEKVQELTQVMQNYEACLQEDEAEMQAARAEKQRVMTRKHNLEAQLKNLRASQRDTCVQIQEARTACQDHKDAIRAMEAEMEAAHAESQQLSRELEVQTMSVTERATLLDEVDYSRRVYDSKRAVTDQIAKTIQSKETELALWQKKTLDSCAEYKQGLIHLSTPMPGLAALAIDERELMGSECFSRVSTAVDMLRTRAAELLQQKHARTQLLSAGARQRANKLEESRKNIAALKLSRDKEQQAFDLELLEETEEEQSWRREEQEISARMEELDGITKEYAKIEKELEFYEKEETIWRVKLSEMREYLNDMRDKLNKQLDEAKKKRANLVIDQIQLANRKIN